MAHSIGNYSSSSSGGNGFVDFHLPDEILAVIPTDPYDQLDLARKITSMAIASRVSRLESEAGRLRQTVADRDRTIYELQEKIAQLEVACRGADERLRATLDENMNLTNERDSLAATAKKLNRDLVKLETFKRQLMQSLSEDSSSQAETVDIGPCDQSVAKASSVKDEGSNGYVAPNLLSGSTGMRDSVQNVSSHAGQRFSASPYMSSRVTPTASTGGSPRGFSTTGSPRLASGTTSPTKSQFDGRGVLSSWYPASQQSSMPSSPPQGRSLAARTPRIDGKEFFRQARSRLSYEQFGAFLANIKELNAQKQSREETLRRAEEIFGIENKDLYLSFQGLLNRSLA
ncbi:uncharacterized protein At4g15545-like [Magnolia sinica]|uniref:uncharacterized protein At4g15545-like n=1 Tax=Magnolia sinica TaxID=86752 RepID=UPI002658BE77|nr:uncharacterized protein At4g15545-like [Magnolia sinica]